MSKRRLRIAYATRGDVTSQSSFDVGTRYYIGKYLEKHLGAVDFLGPLDTIAHNLWHRSKRRFYKYVLHRRYLPERAPRVRDCYAAQVREKLERKRYDLVFSPDSIVISSLDVDIPIVFYTDAVFDAMIDFYPHFTNLCRESIRDGHNQEQCALDKSALAIYSSQWAVDAVIQHHEVDPQKVTYVPFGACLPSLTMSHFRYMVAPFT